MVFGEIGNFSAYGFAPASLVAPLGTTTVIGKQEVNEIIAYTAYHNQPTNCICALINLFCTNCNY
jgi:hypothetical protein